MKLIKLLALALTLALAGTAGTARANVIITIDQTGANDPVSSSTPRAWNFGITDVGAQYFSANGITFDTAIFWAKDGVKTTDSLTFTLYSGLGGDVAGNTILAQVTLPASVFNQQYANGADNPFTFTGLTLTTGYYSATLTTTASNSANQEYFLKDGKLVLENSDGTTLASSYWLQDQGTGSAGTSFNGTGSLISDTVTLAPEVNATWAMGIVGAISFGGMFVRKGRKRQPAVA
jgi:hypothetical protein